MSKYTGYKPESAKSTAKYIREKCDRLSLVLPKGTKDKWKKQATQAGAESLTKYITHLMEIHANDQ